MKNFSDPTARPRPVAMVTQMLEQKQALHTRTHTTQVKVFLIHARKHAKLIVFRFLQRNCIYKF